MSNNHKNELQIYCQKRQLPLPVYTYRRNDDDLWVSTVSVQIQGDSKQFTGEPSTRKTNADISAAHVALESIDSSECIQGSNVSIIQRKYTLDKNTWQGDYPMCILVDYENINKLDKLHNVFVDKNGKEIKTCKFVAYSNHKAETDEPSHIVNSPGKDAVDHYITFVAGMLTQQYLLTEKMSQFTIIVLSRDLFASHLEKFIPVPHSHKFALKHFTSEKKCLDYLEMTGHTMTDKKYSYQD